ncbi:MAG: hypothetical protein D6813_13920 [Calditrichaeota bacterium]|nr:MAG: hypothetical protein D6813_13920 [Calditrichota bacterium]
MASIVSNINNQTPAIGSPSPEDIVNSFRVYRGVEGKQITIEWDLNFANITEIKLIRKRFSFPTGLEDGKEIFSESSSPFSTYYIDEDIDELVFWYYKLFYKTVGGQSFISSKKLEGFDFTCTTGELRQKLWQLLPATAYHVPDIETQKLRVQKTLASLDNNEKTIEYLHLNTNGSNIGQFQRFIYLFGTFFDEILCLIKMMPVLWDVENTRADYLKFIAPLVGLELNLDIPIDKQRNEILDAVKTYKTKGTKAGILSHVRKITGLEAQVNEQISRILISNRVDRKSLDFSSLTAFYNLQVCDEEFHFSLDFSINSFYSFEYLKICVFLDENGLSDTIVKKLVRTIQEWTPADTIARIAFIDNDFRLNTDFLFYNSFLETFFDTQDTRSYLYSNDTNLISNSTSILSLVI